MKDEDVLATYNKTFERAVELLKDEVNPLEVAACSVQVGLTIYRSTLSEEDYDTIVQRIVESCYHIRTIDEMSDIPADRVLH
jgi:hypothetical protein